MDMDADGLWKRTLHELTKDLAETTLMRYFGGEESVGTSLSDDALSVLLPEDKDVKQAEQLLVFIEPALQRAGGAPTLKVRFSVRAPERREAPRPEPVFEETPAAQESKLNPQFTFENFVQGPSNEFPLTMAKYIARNPGDSRSNPLFLYGPTGVGKTHLLHAIGHEARRQKPGIRVLYVTSEGLMNEYVRSWKQDELREAFRTKFRTPDILLVDDVQYMAGKKGLQDEFFNIFNALRENNSQIVMTSDRPPAEITDVADRLIGRFQHGPCLDIDMPQYETRLNILMLKAQSFPDVTLGPDILKFIAERVSSSVRALEGALTSTVNYIRVLPGCDASLVTVDVLEKSILKAFIDEESEHAQLTPEIILETAAKNANLPVAILTGESRVRGHALPRQVAIFLSRKLTACSMKDIGRCFGRTHTTVIHSCNLIQDLYREGDANVVRMIKEILQMLGKTISDLAD